MDKKYIEAFGQLETTHWWFLIRKKIILLVLHKYIFPQKKILKILNVGAAAGASSKWLETLGDVTSVEYDDLFFSYLQSRNFPVTKASITNLPFADESFDLVCALDVIEHVENDSKAVSELFRVCKTGSKICITVPAFQSLWGSHDIANSHYRRYKKKQLKNLVKNAKSSILYISYFNTILFPFIYLFRKINSLSKKDNKKIGSDFESFTTNKAINAILKMLFGIELFLLKFMKFPFGVSLIMLLEKQSGIEKIQQ
jgi:SAM-dependent methyltransferase